VHRIRLRDQRPRPRQGVVACGVTDYHNTGPTTPAAETPSPPSSEPRHSPHSIQQSDCQPSRVATGGRPARTARARSPHRKDVRVTRECRGRPLPRPSERARCAVEQFIGGAGAVVCGRLESVVNERHLLRMGAWPEDIFQNGPRSKVTRWSSRQAARFSTLHDDRCFGDEGLPVLPARGRRIPRRPPP
jgi:hypothetical protein